ncbi:MAG: hypothetical protein WA958_18555 [Tunicatimonas sp.]
MKTILIALSVFLLPWLARAQALPVVGYFTQEKQLVFEFDAAQHSYAVQENDGNVVPTSSLTIFSVALAGEFNGWQTDQYPMKTSDSTTYRVQVPLDSLGAADSQFAFVINNFYWVEPTLEGVNRVPAPCWLISSGSVYTTLLYKHTIAQLLSDATLTDSTARQWLMEHAAPAHTYTPAGLDALKQFTQNKQAIGLGHDSLTTFPVRLRIAELLLSGMEYPMMAFHIDDERAEQINQYLDKGFAVMKDDYSLEVIQVMDWSYEHEEVDLVGYQREDIRASLNDLEMLATDDGTGQLDTAWLREVNTLVEEVRSLLDLQQTWGLYYYDSPSFQEYLLLALCSVRDNLPELPDDRQEKVERAVTVINRYLTNLSNLKSYYGDILAELDDYFSWVDTTANEELQLLVWAPNEEMNRDTPGSVGQYLDQKYQDHYLAVGVGTYRFAEAPLPASLEQRFPGVAQERDAGSSMYVIDLREAALSPEETAWLARKVYHREADYQRTLNNDFDVLLLVNEPEPPAVLK